MKNNEGKAGVILLIIVLLLIFALAGVYGYLYVIKLEDKINVLENERNTLQNTQNNLQSIQNTQKTIVNESDDKVKTSDLVTLYSESTTDHAELIYAFIEDGELYYYNKWTDQTEGNSSTYLWCFGNKEEMTKYPNLNNIKRIKRFNLGTSVNPELFLITEDGKVYKNYHGGGDFRIDFRIYPELEEYQVEDILEHNGELYDVWTILLKDGTTKEVTVKDDNM